MAQETRSRKHVVSYWNQLIEWARQMVQEEPLILDIETEPSERPVAWTGRAADISYNEATNKHLIEWWKPETYLLTGYQAMSLVTGELASAVARDIAHRGAFAGARKGKLNPNLETLPLAYHSQARTGRTWTRILEVDNRGHTECEHLTYAVRTCDLTVSDADSTAMLLRRFALHVAAQEPLVIEESEETA